MNSIICGVDVSKDWLDVFIRPLGVSQRFSNDASGIGALGALCLAEAVELVLEANRTLAEESIQGKEVIREPLVIAGE